MLNAMGGANLRFDQLDGAVPIVCKNMPPFDVLARKRISKKINNVSIHPTRS